MASLKNIKLKIQSVKKTRQVTKAMEAVSAVKMRKTQEQALGARPYAAAALAMLQRLAGSGDMSRFAQVKPKADAKTCLIVITSDKGLAGALNSGMNRSIEKTIKERNLTPANTLIYAIGRRGADYLVARGFEIKGRLENVSDQVDEGMMRAIADDVMALQSAGEISSCLVAYTNFRSTFEQQPVVRQLLPLDQKVIEEMVKGIAPVKGKFAQEGLSAVAPATYTVEPSPEAVLKEVLPKLFGVGLFHALAEAKASEHSARMVAMKNATDKAGEVAHDLTLRFNKARQAAITGEVSEITSGIEAMR